ncbi:MAG: PilZ domain-containing protein [Phycisphaerales bacterium]|nr:MAG: PilZ domain-containing protein [Phycisphaerales bacterium]
MSTMTLDERRAHPRIPCARPAKVFLPATLRFAAAETADVSDGGALVRIDADRLVRVGERIEVAIVQPGAPGSGLIESKSMRPARVVRVTPMDYFHQAVALAYDDEDTLANAA